MTACSHDPEQAYRLPPVSTPFQCRSSARTHSAVHVPRADILKLTFTERSTGELARELGISAATVSGHTKTLRGVGLIVSTRAGKAVYHCLTPLGNRLLNSAPPLAADATGPSRPHGR